MLNNGEETFLPSERDEILFRVKVGEIVAPLEKRLEANDELTKDLKKSRTFVIAGFIAIVPYLLGTTIWLGQFFIKSRDTQREIRFRIEVMEDSLEQRCPLAPQR